MKILDLFSCIGCHAQGMLNAGHEIVALCENNPFRQRVLKRRFPQLPLYDDVHTLIPPLADVCFGGPPCQQTSVGAAINGHRTGASLWPNMLAAGINAECEWFVVEQPPGNAAWEAKVCNALCRLGKHVAIFEFGAHDIGAPYIRRRRYIVAGPSLQRLALARQSLPSAIECVKRATIARGNWNPASIPAFGVDTWRTEQPNERRERIEALGDSNPAGMAEVIGLILNEANV